MWIWQPSKVNVLNLAPLDSSYAATKSFVDVMMVPSNTAQILILLNCDKCIYIVLDF